MKLHNLSQAKYKAAVTGGFTLIELLVVIGILALMVGLGYFLSMDQFRGDTFRSERDVVLSAFQQARSYAISNIDEAAHGIRIENNPPRYILFTGTTYNASDPNNQVIEGKKNTSSTGQDTFIFKQLSGDVDDEGSVTITDGVKTTTITVNHEGQISW